MLEVILTVEALAVVLCAVFAWSWLRPAPPPLSLPSAGSRWPILGSLQSLSKGKDILHRVYQRQLRDNQPYLLRGIFGDSIVLPPSMLPWLISQPESQLSAKWAQMDALNIPITFLRADIGLNPVHEPLVRRNLTAQLDRIAGELFEEVGAALEDLWGDDTETWREVNLDHTIRRVVARASNRVFVGTKLCRDNDYIENSISYVTKVSTCGLLLSLFPSWIRRAAGVILTIPIRLSYNHCSKHLLPIFSNLVLEQEASASASPSQHLFSSWIVSNALKYPPSSPERTPDYMARRIMALNFAAIHTSTLTTCSLFLDVFSHSPAEALLLRDECLAGHSRWGETWNRARLNQMQRLDSTLRESLRLWGLVPKAMSRKIMHPSGTALPSGQQLPSGATVCISGWGLHHDESVYPKPFEFRHDRFVKTSRDEQGKDRPAEAATTRKLAFPEDRQTAAAETDGQFAVWGIGKHACPGRFFAVDLIKIILGHVLVDYEVKFLRERPENIWIEYNVIPPPTATLSIRRRKTPN